MDHKRIQWLFLIVFLLIDIYLGIEIVRSPVNLSSGATNPNVTNIRSEMTSDGIEIPKVSNNQSSGYYLAAKNKDYLSQKLSSLTQVDTSYDKSTNTLNATPKIEVMIGKSRNETLKILNKFKNDPKNIPYGDQYHYEENLSGENSYVYVQTSEYGNIYDNAAQLIITTKDDHIDNYSLTYLGTVSPVRELQTTISAWHAIRTMYTNRELANNSRVTEIKLGYSELTDVNGSTILLPTWLVWVENKATKNVTLKRVNAFTAQIIQNNGTYNVTK